MNETCVSMTDFKQLEKKINHLLSLHEIDSDLSQKEKRLVSKAKSDIKRKSNFVSVADL